LIVVGRRELIADDDAIPEGFPAFHQWPVYKATAGLQSIQSGHHEHPTMSCDPLHQFLDEGSRLNPARLRFRQLLQTALQSSEG
jgi:hypothetical protein